MSRDAQIDIDREQEQRKELKSELKKTRSNMTVSFAGIIAAVVLFWMGLEWQATLVGLTGIMATITQITKMSMLRKEIINKTEAIERSRKAKSR